jgi:hypothetical protein
MPEKLLITKWACPLCDEPYDNEEDARECQRDCQPLEAAVRIEEEVIRCTCCRKKKATWEEALDCERRHEDKQDRWWFAHLSLIERDKLDQAAAHKSQRTLEETAQ